MMNLHSRQDLKNKFATNKMPKGEDFAALIDSALIQQDDELFRDGASPLRIIASKSNQELGLIDFYSTASTANPSWKFAQGLIAGVANAKEGLSLRVGDVLEFRGLFVEKDSGHVGVGTAKPEQRLHVAGGIKAAELTIGTTAAPSALVVGSNGNVGVGKAPNPATAIKLDVSGAINATGLNVGNNAIVVNSNGNVGIGIIPLGQSGKLQVDGDVRINDGALWLRKGVDKNHGIRFEPSNNDGPDGPFVFGYGGGILGTVDGKNRNNAIQWLANGNVGIGTKPTNARLDVRGSQHPAPLGNRQFDYWNKTDYSFKTSNVNSATQYSIYCDNRIGTLGYDNFSDARIKTVRGRSDGVADLATLSRIEIADYTHKDPIAKDNRPHKKVVGQQVEEVFPQAISLATEVVPDIYRKAPVQDGWVMLATDLKPGDRVRLIAETSEGLHEVLDVQHDRFRTPFNPDGSEVFVYGRQVNDFRLVDYDAIAMLNVSATQQIKREKDAEVNALQDGYAALRALCAELSSRLNRLEQDLERLAFARQ